MNLFHETENKYYELLSLLVNKEEEFNSKKLSDYIDDYIIGECDYEVIDTLFSTNEGEETIFSYSDGVYQPVMPAKLPIRLNKIETLAARSMVENRYASHFLSKETLNKLENVASGIPVVWDINDIEIKNQYSMGVKDSKKIFEKELSIIGKAISEKRAISYDNILPGKYEYIGTVIFPVKIEYSYINDLFRITGYDEAEDRFIKVNLSTLNNIALLDDKIDDLEKEYEDFIEINTKTVEIDVDPIGHVIERCFRIFSYYDRQARFDKEENKYKLTISYLKQDENEVIRDILSLGSYVVVVQPRRIQKEVYKRILAARDNYKN